MPMMINHDSLIENLTSLTLAIGERAELRKWFHELAQKPAHQRTGAILAMSERIATEGKDAALASSFKLLADSRVFDAARMALEKYDHDDE